MILVHSEVYLWLEKDVTFQHTLGFVTIWRLWSMTIIGKHKPAGLFHVIISISILLNQNQDQQPNLAQAITFKFLAMIIKFWKRKLLEKFVLSFQCHLRLCLLCTTMIKLLLRSTWNKLLDTILQAMLVIMTKMDIWTLWPDLMISSIQLVTDCPQQVWNKCLSQEGRLSKLQLLLRSKN